MPRNPLTRVGPLGMAMLLAQLAPLIRRHWQKLTPYDQGEFRRLITKARGRPSNLTDAERVELQRMIRQLELGAFGRELIGIVSPIGRRGHGHGHRRGFF